MTRTDASNWALVPSDRKRIVVGEEHERVVVEVGVYDLGEIGLAADAWMQVVEPGCNDTGCGAFITVGVGMVPDMSGVVLDVRRALQPVLGPEGVQSSRSKSRSDDDRADQPLKWLQDVLTKARPCFNGEVRIVRRVHDTECRCNLGMQELSKEEVLRKPGTTKFLKFPEKLSHANYHYKTMCYLCV
ncbi:MAG: hypothetical protein EOP24_34380 [Hyphomicrobiales bacterium]|nr:MAG: hypothetical protein EOP24_34380 [Hyphomicrobiales bacterium]